MYHNKNTNAIDNAANFYSSISVTANLVTGITAGQNVSFTPNNRQVHIGLGSLDARWIGYLGHAQFGGSVPTTLQTVIAEVKAYDENTSAGSFDVFQVIGHGGTSAFPRNYFYRFKYSLIFDGLQESPLSHRHKYDLSIGANNYDYVTITIKAFGAYLSPSSFNPRITGVNLYVAESITGDESGLGLYRKIASADINSASWTISGNDKIYQVIYRNAGESATYEANSGMPETLENSTLKYSLATTISGYHIVGGCIKTELPEAAQMLFKSKSFRYDMFDWSNDYLYLPERPTALSSYNGRIYVFSRTNMYMINPEGFYIEDVYKGVGCFDARSIISVNDGMFWHDSKNIYWLKDGIRPISYPIQNKLRTAVTTEYNYPVLAYSSSRNSLIVITEEADGLDTGIYSYHLVRERWDYFKLTSTVINGAFSDRNGYVYIAVNAGLYALYNSTSYRNYTWTSKEMTFNDPSQDKKIYDIVVDSNSTGTIALTYGLNGSAPSTAFTSGQNIKQKAKSIKIKIAGTAGRTVQSIGIVFRGMIGKR